MGERPSLHSALPRGDAYISPDGLYRYSLTRQLREIPCDCFVQILDGAGQHSPGCALFDERTLTFVGLNPSTADATTDDPTIRRCVRYAREWGYHRLKMVNLYAYRATDPAELGEAERSGIDIVGPENDHVLSLVFGGSDMIVAAWGAIAPDERVAQFAETFGKWRFYALGMTQTGRPRHPLYMRADVQPFIYGVSR